MLRNRNRKVSNHCDDGSIFHSVITFSWFLYLCIRLYVSCSRITQHGLRFRTLFSGFFNLKNWHSTRFIYAYFGKRTASIALHYCGKLNFYLHSKCVFVYRFLSVNHFIHLKSCFIAFPAGFFDKKGKRVFLIFKLG